MSITHLWEARALHCTALNDDEQRAEIWTKGPTIPAASVAKVVHWLALYAVYSILG